MNRDERAGGPLAPGVHGPRQHALARPALAAQEHRRVGGSDLKGDFQRLPHARFFRVEFHIRGELPDLFLQSRDAIPQPANQRRPVEHDPELVRA